MGEGVSWREPIIERIPKAEPGKPFWWPSLDVGDGWRDLIVKLDADIAAIYPDYQLHQCKEKFGGLRYYIGSVPDEVSEEVNGLISAAESASYNICDVCGKEGKLRTTGGWHVTRCDEHA